MKITIWNVNSIKARTPHVQRFLKERSPDVLMVQELKGENFPHDDFADAEYTIEAVGQKAYNGVAIFSKSEHNMRIVHTALPSDSTDEQARYIEADVNGLRLINIYAPNGNPMGTEKFDYKLAWLKRLHERLHALRNENTPFIIGGDFNIIPTDEDCHDPNAWRGDALFQPQSIAMYRAFINLGLSDAFRTFNQQPEQYSFWDYQAGAWPKNNGIRIDHFLTSPMATDRTQSCIIDKEPRGWERPSDHTPVSIEIDW